MNAVRCRAGRIEKECAGIEAIQESRITQREHRHTIETHSCPFYRELAPPLKVTYRLRDSSRVECRNIEINEPGTIQARTVPERNKIKASGGGVG